MVAEAKIAPDGNGHGKEVRDSFNSPGGKMIHSKTERVDVNDYAYEEEEEINDKDEDSIEAYRIAVKKFFATTVFGQLYDNTLLLMSIGSCLEFIVQTYMNPVKHHDLIVVFDQIEQGLAVLFSVDWLLNFFLAEHKIIYISSFYSMVDILTVIPIWVSVYSYVPTYDNIENFRDVIVYFLCGLATTRILRALRIRKKLIVIEDEVERCVGEIALALVVMILFFTALIQYLEKEVQPLPFHTYMYFMAVTITTVGYGDISPESEIGQFIIMIMIFFAIVAVPQMTNNLIETMGRQSIYARLSFHPKGKASTHSHVVMCGEFGALALEEFFEELFHEDHENLNLHAVVLSQDPPSNDMGILLRDPVYSMNVTFLEGSALSQNDLKRACASQAISIFIMTNKFSSDPDEEDAKTILQQFSIKQHIAQVSAANKSPLLCIQIVRPENRRHLIQPSLNNEDGDQEDLVMCLNELKMGVIAKAVMFQGTNTLIMNLLTSFADDDDEKEEVHEEIDNLNSDDTNHWMYEYQRGCDWEIYTTELSEKFVGGTFVKLSEALYQRFGIVLFALQIEDLKKDRSNIRVLLNPASFVIPSKADFKIDAFVMAKNANQSDLSFSDGSEDDDNALPGISHMTKLHHHSIIDNHNHKKEPEANEYDKKHSWQKLLRKYDNSASRNGSEQEVFQKVEDAYLHENFFTLNQRAAIDDCTIKTSMSEEFPGISGHTIIIGKSLSSLYDLIKNLRAKYLEILRHIIILTPTEIPHAVWSRISIYKCVLVLRGSPLEEADILRAGIFKAAQVIVLADAATESKSGKADKAGSVALIDADAVFSYQCVKRMNESASCVVEIVKSQNVGYLDPQAVVQSGGHIEYKFTPQFASGALFTSSLLDTLVCQAFYNPKIISVISELFSGVERKNRNELLANIRGDTKTEKKGVAAIVGSTLYQISVPELESRTYGSLFRHLCNEGIIPLGLYRGIFSHMNIGPKQNKSCYCFTNPSKDTELFSCDKVYVLSPRPLIASSKKNVKMAEAAMTRKVNENSTSNHDVRHEILRVEGNLNERMSRLEDMVAHSFDTILETVNDIGAK